jgi:hypothetical protein
MKIAKILGQDDWLFYARTDDGTLVYTVQEISPAWWDAPHGGECWDETTGRNCSGDSKMTCRIDAGYAQLWVTRHADHLDWHACGNDPVSGEYMGWGPERDQAFMDSSRRNYLPD